MSVIYWARFFREATGGWSVDVPDMPGCLTQGETFEEAYRYLLEEAMPLWLEGETEFPPARPVDEILAVARFDFQPEPVLAQVTALETNESATYARAAQGPGRGARPPAP